MSPQEASVRVRELVGTTPVIPVLVIEDLADAEPLAQALVAGGLPVLEVTLRTPVALQAMEVMARVPGAIVAAGTVLSARDVAASQAAGAQFAVSPGATPALIAACRDAGLPLLPGAATASEVMALIEAGFDFAKFFPAEVVGGAPALKALHGPLPAMRFCPTGGITAQNAASYLQLPNVAVVGGSWLTPKDLIAAKDWSAIEGLARAARALV